MTKQPERVNGLGKRARKAGSESGLGKGAVKASPSRPRRPRSSLLPVPISRVWGLVVALMVAAGCGNPGVGGLPTDPGGGGDAGVADAGTALPDAGVPTELVHFVGRFDFSQPDRPRLGWRLS